MSFDRPIQLQLNNSTVADEFVLAELERLPWHALILGNDTYFLKLRFLTDTYALLITDMVLSLISSISAYLGQRFNPVLDSSVEGMLQMMQQWFLSPDPTVTYSVLVDDAENKLTIDQAAKIDFYSFSWRYTCTGLPMRNSLYLRDYLIKPLLFINYELQRQTDALKVELVAKDREIQAYVNKGQRIMKGIATAPFVATEWTDKQLTSPDCLSAIDSRVSAVSMHGLTRKLFQLYADHKWPASPPAPPPAGPAASSLQLSTGGDPFSSPRLDPVIPANEHERSDRGLSQEEAWDLRHGAASAPGPFKLPSLSASLPAPSQPLLPPPASAAPSSSASSDKSKRRVRTQTPESGSSQQHQSPQPQQPSGSSHDSKEYVESTEELKRREAIERKLALELEKKAQKAEKATKKKRFNLSTKPKPPSELQEQLDNIDFDVLQDPKASTQKKLEAIEAMRNLLQVLNRQEKFRGLRTAGIDPDTASAYLDKLAHDAVADPREKLEELRKPPFPTYVPDTSPSGTYSDCTLIMQLLRDNLTLWTADPNEVEEEKEKSKLG